MNIVEIMQTKSMNGLTLSEMRAKVRMNIALKAFGKWQKRTSEFDRSGFVDSEPEKPTPKLSKDFYNLFS